MASRPKQFHEGYWYHVYARSPVELNLFETDEERVWFIDKLDEVFDRRRTSLGALCLMDTHYHALVRMGPVRLDRVLNGLHMSYTKRVNGPRGREGSLFRKHPGTDIVLDDSYLLQLVPYIHHNPVDAGIVEEPEAYEWHTDSLFRTGEWKHGPLDSWEWPPHFEGGDRLRRYRERMGEKVDYPEGGDGYVGEQEEWDDLEKRDESRSDRYRNRRGRPTMEEIAGRFAEEDDTTVRKLKEPGRKQPYARLRHGAMCAMYREGYGPKEIGDFFRRSKSTVMYAVRNEDTKE